MLIKPTEYNGETIIKLSVLVKLADDILSLIKDVSDDPALLIDVQAIRDDIQALIESLKIMELPNIYQSPHPGPSEEQQK